jgi:hypothetical protein
MKGAVMQATKKVDLTTICGGAVPEVWAHAFQEIIENINDPNTDPKKARRITMVFDFIPDTNRNNIAIKFGVAAKPVPVSHVESNMYLAREGATLNAYTTDIRQQEMEFEPSDKKIVTLKQ